MIQVEYAELTEAQQERVEALSNDTIPQGQSFFLEGEVVIAVENNVRELFEAQNQKAIDAGSVKEII